MRKNKCHVTSKTTHSLGLPRLGAHFTEMDRDSVGEGGLARTWSRSVGTPNGLHPSHPRRRPLPADSAHDTTDGREAQPETGSAQPPAECAGGGRGTGARLAAAAGSTGATAAVVAWAGVKRPDARKRERMSSASAR